MFRLSVKAFKILHDIIGSSLVKRSRRIPLSSELRLAITLKTTTNHPFQKENVESSDEDVEMTDNSGDNIFRHFPARDNARNDILLQRQEEVLWDAWVKIPEKKGNSAILN
ncbi:uncharacterized protein LOC127286663 [Leptopilina boulardi]|uniref:uncharacterized protein LOC127286663 n=1 Tax=Leptopilina boulardi TaxID=63433 RepID=UPI0021F5625C|nr:uncharacterized protein LOC127286663 [Leptopilina boulardi]XP_051169125.1 uncharacterized protein LOC127286663 [Leptopilina boulardi]